MTNYPITDLIHVQIGTQIISGPSQIDFNYAKMAVEIFFLKFTILAVLFLFNKH